MSDPLASIHGNKTNNGTDDDEQGGCCTCKGIRDDFRMTFFQLEDHKGRTIDVNRSFNVRSDSTDNSSSQPSYFTAKLLIKTLICGFALATIAGMWSTFAHPYFFLAAYETHWALLYSVIYLTMSYILTVFHKINKTTSASSITTTSTKNGNAVTTTKTRTNSWMVDLIWVMFTIAASQEIVVFVLFWTLDFQPGVDTVTVRTCILHGGMMVLVLFEGLCINHVPVRLKHSIPSFLLMIMYLGGTSFENLVCKCNPMGSHYHDNQDENAGNDVGGDVSSDDALYTALPWHRNPIAAGRNTAAIVLVLSPIIALILCYLSFSGRQYERTSEEDVVGENNDMGDDNGDDGIVMVKPYVVTTKAGRSKQQYHGEKSNEASIV